jgi:alpha-1,6-mannosyltransferase
VHERPRLELIEGGARPRPARGPALELMALGTGVTLAAVLLARLPSWRAELGTFQGLFAAAFAFYAIAVWRSTRDAPPIAPSVVLVVALAARVALLPVTPSLSNAIYRDVWEGRVLAAGHDPYRLAPLAPELAPLRDQTVFPRVDHPELAAISPPLALAGYALVSKLSPTLWAMKVWILLHDLALVWLLVFWVRGRGQDATAAIAYAWCPLVLTEFAGSGHPDPVAMVWLIAALMYAVRRPTFSAVALSIAALTQLLPIVALPFVWRSWTWRARILALTMLAVGLGVYLFETLGSSAGLAAASRGSTHNALLFAYLQAWLGDPLRARILAAALLAMLVISLTWRRIAAPEATRATLRGASIVTPVAHPWLFTWAMLLEPLGRSPGWVVLSLTCMLAYGLLPPRGAGDFELSLGGIWVEYAIPLIVAGTFALARRRRERTTPRRDRSAPRGRR